MKYSSSRHRRFRLPLLLVAGLFLVGFESCPDGSGYVDHLSMGGRSLAWLENATAVPLNPGSLLQSYNYMQRARVDPRFSVAENLVGADAWDATFQKLFTLRDTSDFQVMSLLNLLYVHDGDPMVSPELWQKAKQAILDFKYWFTDPTPVREVDGANVIDDMWYWTENHSLIFHTDEYLAGLLFPDEVFTVSGMTGAEHAARALPKIRRWLDERARFGFLEWHSNVYYALDVAPLLTLIEHAPNQTEEEQDLVTRASMVLDLVLFDIALHLHKGTFGATHGRSYIKDKPSATKEDTYDLSKLIFDDTHLPFQSRSSRPPTLLASALRYRLPEVIRRVAAADAPMIDRERMNLPVPEEPPAQLDPLPPQPPAPFGLDWLDEENLTFWWSAGAWSSWLVLPLTFEVATRENLWNTESFEPFLALRDLVWKPDEGLNEAAARGWLQGLLWQRVSLALLEEVNTYTYRTPHYMLSTAQDYRKGLRADQVHSWQATLGEQAMVFTTHPSYLPPDEPTVDWQKEDEPGPGYWTGESSMPRSAQHENVGIHIYAPQYEGWLGWPVEDFNYLNETHAYFPHAHFDEVTQGPSQRWTFGRKGDAYVALYSYVPTIWRTTGPEVFENGGLPFDLVAPGEKNNVWIVECGDAARWGSFEEFQRVILEESVVVVDEVGDHTEFELSDGFNVDYTSPSLGLVTFGWEEPLVVAGGEVPIGGYKRFDNPYAQVDFAEMRYEISDGEYDLVLDFNAGTREAAGPSSPDLAPWLETLAEIIRALFGLGGSD